MRRWITTAVAVAALMSTEAHAKQCEGENLEPSEDLRVGTKHRVPAEDCPRKSQNGDRLTMHYTGKVRTGAWDELRMWLAWWWRGPCSHCRSEHHRRRRRRRRHHDATTTAATTTTINPPPSSPSSPPPSPSAVQ